MRASPRLLPAAVFIAATLLALTASPTSHAALGDLTFKSCIADEGKSGCNDTGIDPLDAAGAVAVSPDGRSVYVASWLDDSLSVYSRTAAGALLFRGCIADEGRSGCNDTGIDPLGGAYSIAVSPDGTSVYVASIFDDSLSVYRRNAAGDLLFRGCIADEGTSGCNDVGIDALNGASSVAVSPDGRSVYVTSIGDNALSVYSRNAVGDVFFRGCIADEGKSGCNDVGIDPLGGARSVAVSPDGMSVYVASDADDSLSVYSRDAVGDVFFRGCIADEGKSGCNDAGIDPLDGVTSIAVSPDGRSVYAAAIVDHSLSVYSRNALGDLFFRGCIANEGQSGCNDTGIDPLDGASSVTVSPDGRSVYVASQFEDSLTVYSRDAAGDVFFRGCIANEGQSGCNDTGIDPLDGASSVAVSPDGTSVYVASFENDSVTHFAREVPRFCAGQRATIVGTQARDQLRGTRRRDVIVALGGADTISGLGGNDLVCAGPGNDTVLGGDGQDVVFAGDGNDRVLGGAGEDTLRGEAGADRLLGQAGPDRLFGGAGRDHLVGGTGRDLLVGGPGKDVQTQ